MEVYRMIQAYHHANRSFRRLEGIFRFFSRFCFELLGRGTVLLLWEGPVVENMVLAHETMDPRDCTDEPAI